MAFWHYTVGGQPQNPIALQDLQMMLANGQVQPGDLVWTEGMAQWQPAGTVPELAMNAGYPPQGPGGYYAPPGPGGYQLGYQNQYAYANAPGPGAGLAQTAMILAIISPFVGTLLTGIAALVCGWVALARMKRSGNYQGKGKALSGVIVGCLWLVVLVGFIGYFVVSAR